MCETPGVLRKLKASHDAQIAISLFAISFVFHIITAARTVTFSDSGDFLMAVSTVGNCHGPGYPLYLMTAKLFSWVFPFGSLAFRASVYSGIFASATICLVYWIVVRISRSRIGGVVGALAFCFSYTFWYESVIPETYSLNCFFIALLIVLAIRWEKLLAEGRLSGAENTLCLFAFCYGLALSNHITILFLLPAFVFFALYTNWRNVLAPRNFLRMVVFLVLGLLPYFYQPAAAFRGPAYNHGDPSTPKRWFEQITMVGLRGGVFGYPFQFLPYRMWRYLSTLNTEFPYFAWLCGIGLVGSFVSRKKKYPLFLLLLFLLSLLPVMTYRQIESVLRAHFYYSSYLIISLWIGLGVACLLALIKRYSGAWDRLVEVTAVVLAAALLLTCPAAAAVTHYRKIDKSRYYYAHDMGMRMLEPTEEGSVLISDSDNAYFPTRYLQVVEGIRPDVRNIALGSEGYPGFEGGDLHKRTVRGYQPAPEDSNYTRLVERNYRDLPVYTTDPGFMKYEWTLRWDGYLIRILPAGRGDRGQRKGRPVPMRGADAPQGDLDSDAREALLLPGALEALTWFGRKDFQQASKIYRSTTTAFVEDLYVPTLYSCATFTKLYELWGLCLNTLGRYGDTVRFLPRALAIDPDFMTVTLAVALDRTGETGEAIVELDKIVTLFPDDAMAYRESGRIYFKLQEYEKALSDLEKAARLDSDDPQTYYLMSLVLARMGRRAEAVRRLNIAKELAPETYGGVDADRLKSLMP